ncbi:MAG: hypothetical protein KDD70_00555, partial [Bdellovibrionales bacterium]|nr:hypothetical protein [Bdellovibrionales bacterium]
MLFLCVLCACPVLLLAQDDGFEYTVSITETVGSTEVPVEGVQVKGNNGVSELAGLFTGIDGNISFDIRDLLTTLDTALVFHREGYSFEPSEISLEDCVGGVCYVTASRTNPSALVRVLAVDQNGDPIQDVDTFISGTPNGCTRKTDSNGVAYFSIPVRANLAACNDTDAIYGENDYNTVFATPKNDGRCSLQEIPAISRNLCIRSQPSGTIDVVVTGTCAANPSPPAPLAAGRYSIPVILDSGAVLLNNLQIYPVDQSVYSSQNGNSFDITQYGLSADQTITVFPVGSRSFYPKSMVVNRTTCPGGYCQPFRAKPTSTLLAQHILPVDITDSNDEGVSGVRIVAQGEDFCSSDVPRFTNGEGRTHVAAVLRQSCTKDSDYITIKPSLPGYAFSHDDDFRFCPTSVESGFVATAVASEPSAFHTVSGRITTSLNESFSRVQIVKNGSTAALTRDDGTYSVTVEHGVTTVLQPVYEGYVFNKEEVQILEPSHNISELNFKMIATVDGDPFGPTPPACNPTNGVFTISGFVINSVGQRVSGVKILNEGEMVAITGVDGSYSFPASPGDNLWVTAQYVDPISGEEALFDPSAIAEPILACDKTDFNFMVSDEEAYILSGVVTNEETGEPLESVKISFNLDGEIQTTTSSADGFFLLTTTADDWTATPDNVNYHCTPSSYSGEGGANQAQLDFVCRFDECPTDPSKDEAGQCGCGTPDVDADNDGTAACLDQCDSDPLKIDPGTCGCGISEVDSDNDGTPDCVDECPADSSKSTAGVCGCGTLDDPSDSDGDGTADCADLCIHDPGKTEPGVCGCGTADSDSDLDGTADCNDACPLDDRKTTVGICGCGVSDYDSDGDGTPDCNDQCDHDVKKTAPGICGCGVVDKDTDNDGAYDCNETCDNDPLKTAPGICGCGTPDTDSDGDGVADCNDQCPTDANKSAPGICGCGSIDSAIDSDGDGVPNCNDSCPNDAGKTQPGQCGCGIADVDVDGDGTASCHDQCDSDANKLEPGFCGCGTLDTDTDGDGTPNCNDGCPSDANKVAPGQCGCGVIDRDRDGDGTYDCNDECPTDPSKTAAGSCGCFVAETDSDLDGIADCNDECPMDPEKTTPGHCGCMIPDEDLNNDGIYDCPVNCENPVVVDFDLNGLLAGTMVSDQFAELGVTIRVESTTNSAVLFNSAAPTGGDLDLGAANERFGGPGIGSGINAGDGNETILNNILVIAKSIDDSNLDGLVDNPSNDPAGGRIIFDFERPSSVVSIDILDLDETNDGASLEAIQAPAQMTSAMEEEALSKGKITICHFPPGNPANMRTIEIALSAWDAHEAHGDHVGECIPRQVSPSTVKGFMLDAEVYSKNLSARGDNAKETHYLETRFYVQRLETTFGESAGLAQITFCPTDDECFFDDNKTEPGQCGCGVADTDTDGDGTADCNDQCSNDPTKTSPGSCGCGVLDVDGDGDGTPDCQDSCKSDPNKIAPGACGCGKLDVDTDNDGQLDCKEECPNDPLKTAAGQCGCGVPETDSDLDGTPDCVDLCSAVVQKIAPGQCGCGVVDIDTDGDGVADCVDQCVADPNKSSPGACGCGTADTDTDGDGTPDCQDQCKNDRNKTIPGTCGCGTPDKDSDRDGVLDCNDSCAADPLKSSPGVCGCGVADTDSDGDGFLDCNDSCPTDPSKTTQGVCGCGVAEIDSDGDGTPNCADECSTDAGKIFAGACGCGHPDTDSDDDGVADCIDLCPVDPGKSNAGVCGCGVSDKDTDKDGTADCQD